MKDLFASLLAVFKPASFDGPDPQPASTNAAKEWLMLMDRGDYRAGWNAAAPSLKAAQPCDAWTDTVAARHREIGKVIMREVTGYRFKPARQEDALHTAIVDFRSQYQGALVRERLTLEYAGGTWRTANYLVG